MRLCKGTSFLSFESMRMVANLNIEAKHSINTLCYSLQLVCSIAGDARSKAFLQPYVDAATSLGEYS